MRQHVGEVEAVPHIVELTDDKAEHKEQHQSAAEDALTHLDLRAEEEQQRQKDDEYAAVDIGQTFLFSRLDERDRVGDGLADTLQNAAEIRLAADIDREILGIGVFGGVGIMQGKVSRQHQNRRHHQRQQGEARHLEELLDQILPALVFDDTVADGDQQNKDAGEQSDVVVREHGQCQRDDIESELSFPQQRKGAGNDQRQQRDGVQPDDVPVVAHDKGAQSVHDTERGDGNITALEGDLEEQRVEKSRQTDLDAGDDIQKFSELIRGNQYGEEVQRTRQIIGHQRNIVGTAAALPGPQQRAAVLELVLIVYQKRIVLVPQVGCEDLVGSKRRNTRDLEREEHQDERDEKRQKKVDPHAVAIHERVIRQSGSLFHRGSDFCLFLS